MGNASATVSPLLSKWLKFKQRGKDNRFNVAGTVEEHSFGIQGAVCEQHTFAAAPVGDELEYLDEELAEAFPPHFAL